MICTAVSYRNFRNIKEAQILPDKEINLFIGDNAQGKTNALEGIYLFAAGRSVRTSKESDLILFGETAAAVALCYRDMRREHRMEIKYRHGVGKVCRRNDICIRKMSEFIGNFHAVLFIPQHLSLVKDGPSARRGFIDLALSQLDRPYMLSLKKYNEVLAQRNALIKNCIFSGKSPDETIDLWSEQLAHEAAFIAEKRYEYVCRLNKSVGDMVRDMTDGGEAAEIIYKDPPSEQDFYKQLTSNVEREIKSGATLYGIHRDDVHIAMNGLDARSFASQGQQRSIALAMKLAEGELIKEKTGEYPVFLLDDIMSELDDKRQSYITERILGRQVFITACNSLPEKIKGGRMFRVSKGIISPADGE